MIKRNIFVFILFFISGLLFAQSITVNEYRNRIMHYFENKNNNIIFDTVELYNAGFTVDDPSDFDTNLVFFFYGIKNDNIERYNYFYNYVRQSKNQRLINIFEYIERYGLDGFFINPAINPSLNDVYWTLYFSSGNVKYLDKIIEIAEKHKASNDLMLYLSARSGMWSLKLNIQTYNSILNHFRNIKNDELKNYILLNTVEDITNETIEHIKAQREKGIW